MRKQHFLERASIPDGHKVEQGYYYKRCIIHTDIRVGWTEEKQKERIDEAENVKADDIKKMIARFCHWDKDYKNFPTGGSYSDYGFDINGGKCEYFNFPANFFVECTTASIYKWFSENVLNKGEVLEKENSFKQIIQMDLFNYQER